MVDTLAQELIQCYCVSQAVFGDKVEAALLAGQP